MLVRLALGLAAYLVGSLPFSFLVARVFGVHDVRRVGSGNVGATNVLRTAGKAAGVLAFLLDAGKGAAATGLALLIAPGDDTAAALAAAAAVLGHMYPVWLRFQGGKGVATGFGAFAPLAPATAGIAVLLFLVVAGASRYVSLGSVAGAVTLGVLSFAERGLAPVSYAALLTAALVVFRHRSNLRRILTRTEHRAGRAQE